MKNIVKELTAKDVFITVTAQNEDASLAYDSLSMCMTKRQIKALLEKAETNEWHWCSIAVTAEYMDEDCNEYVATAYLGGCSYKSRLDFIKSNDYYADMVAEVLTDLNSQF